MHRFIVRLSLLVVLVAAGTVGNGSASVLASARSMTPALPRLVPVTSGRHRIDRSLPLAPVTTALSTAPVVPQSAPRTRTLPLPVAPLPAAPDAFHQTAQQILINQDRVGLPPLAWSPCLATIALQNAQRIAAQGYLSHTNGPTLDLGCDPGYTHAGENIAYRSGGIDDAAANTMFMNSPTHRDNILNSNYRFVGTAWVVAPNGYGYIAVEFAG